MKNVKMALVLLTIIGFKAQAQLDNKSVTSSLSIAQQAAISQLDNIVLKDSGTSGAIGKIFNGSDQFHVMANCPIQIDLAGTDLSNGVASLSTAYKFENDSMSIISNSATHNLDHQVLASTEVPATAAAGNYSGSVTVTVSALP